MFLGFDIGNTNTVMGVYKDNSVTPIKTFRYKTEKNPIPDNLKKKMESFLKDKGIEHSKIRGFAFSSVVPEINHIYSSISISMFNIESFEINHKCRLNIKLNYTSPEELGVDRIVNAEAVYNEYKENAIIIDIGTAATFCVLLKNGILDGGLIAPGIGTTINALSENASNLPKIKFEKPDSLVAKDTITAIKSGFFYGWLSLIEGIINRIQNNYQQNLKIIITGGFSEIIGENIEIKNIIDINLTMKGIAYIYLHKNNPAIQKLT